MLPIFRRLLLGCGLALITPIRPAPAQPETKTGYDLIVAAANGIQWGDSKSNGGPSTLDQDLSPAENLRRERLAVARNAPALALLRLALRQPVSVRLEQRFDDPRFPPQGKFREMARQLIQESDVRLADGDTVGALDSCLTAMELGTATTRGGPWSDSTVGGSMEEMGRKRMAPIAAQLSAEQLRTALQRLQLIDARRASYAEMLEAEKQLVIYHIKRDLLLLAAAEAEKQRLGTHLNPPQKGITNADLQEVLALPDDEVAAQITTLFDALLARAALSYQRAKAVEVPPAPNKFIRFDTDGFDAPYMRFGYERNILNSREFEAALELRAIKLESGAYPENFAAPLDPFSDNQPLIYRRVGEGYQLYSVGPDGKDDGGAPIQTVYTDDVTGAQKTRYSLSFNSTGDISAPIY